MVTKECVSSEFATIGKHSVTTTRCHLSQKGLQSPPGVCFVTAGGDK